MIDSDAQKQNFKKVLEVGLMVQTISVIVTYCMKNGKKEFLEKLNEIITELYDSLGEKERGELKADVDAMINQKAEEVLSELSLELPEDEVEKVVEQIKEFSKASE